MKDILIGIDAGTSVIKAVAFNLKGEQLAVSARSNSYVSVESGGVEQEMERTWTDTAETLKDVVAQLDSGRVAAIAVTGQGEGTWLVDSIGKPVAPALLWLDARAAEIVESLEQAPEARRRFRCVGLLRGASIHNCATQIVLDSVLFGQKSTLTRSDCSRESTQDQMRM